MKALFQLEPHHRNVADEEFVADLRRVAGELGAKAVTIDQYNERGRYHASTLARRFGSWFKAIERAGLEKSRKLNISNEELFQNLVEVWGRLGRQPKYNDLTSHCLASLPVHMKSDSADGERRFKPLSPGQTKAK